MKNTLKKLLAFILIFGVIFVSACSGGEKTNSDNGKEDGGNSDAVTIRMAVFENDPNGMMEKARQKFNEEHDNINLEFTQMSNDASQMHDQTVTQLSAGSENLDIVNMDVVWTAEFAESGWLLLLMINSLKNFKPIILAVRLTL